MRLLPVDMHLPRLHCAVDADTAMVVGASVLGWLGLMGNIKGYQTVSVAAVASIAGATSIPFNYAFQVVVFREPLDGLSACGAALVLATTVVMTILRHFRTPKQG